MIFQDITNTLFKDINVSAHHEFEHERIFYYEDPDVNLQSLVAIHDSSRGPAIGGCRFKAYETYEEGLNDVLRLSQGMTHKNILADVPFGGGKAIIFSNNQKSPELLKSFARFLNFLEGAYISAEDIGISLEDIRFIKNHSPHVFDNVDPGPFTARGLFYAIETAIKFYFQSTLKGKKIAIQGAGSVGLRLAYHLEKAGATIYIEDINAEKLKGITSTNITPVENALSQECDLFAPCAVGAILTSSSISQLKCKVIAGGANNQLTEESLDKKIYKLGISYIPDVLINSGGVIGLTKDRMNKSDIETEEDLRMIAQRTLGLMQRARSESISVLEAMNRLVFNRRN